MPRPCVLAHPEPVPDDCHRCKLFVTDERYRRHWEPDAPPVRKAPCRHLGAYTGRMADCLSCPHNEGDSRQKLFACAVHGECTQGRRVAGNALCIGCHEYESVDVLRPDWSLERVTALLSGPPSYLPADFAGYPNVVEAFKFMLRCASENPPAPPDFPTARGVVICAGGWRFFPSLYVTVRAIRYVGCKLPIQVWHLGGDEFDPKMEQALARFSPVGWIDANSMWRDRAGMAIHRERIDHGWMLKPFAAAFSPFAEVLSLDADAYPVRPLEPFFDHPELRRVGACFWPDLKPLEAGQWAQFGVRPHPLPALESGAFFVDKTRHWKPLWLACFLNAYHEYTWKHLYGDKDTYGVAWRLCEHDHCIPTSKPGYLNHSYLQKDFAGRTLFVHRTRDKFKFAGEAYRYDTDQKEKRGNVREDGLPLESECWTWLHECDELIRAEKHFAFRAGTWDRAIWDSVNLQGEYPLPDRFARSDVVLDLGAHIGSFAWACLRRGCARVICVEPEPGNFAALAEHLGPWKGKAVCRNAAAWRCDEVGGAPTLTSLAGHAAENTGAHSLLRIGEGVTVNVVSLDDLIAGAVGERPLRLLKLDVEGAEFPCLFTSRRLAQVREILGEIHPVAEIPEAARVEGRLFTAGALAEHLRSSGFAVALHAHGDLFKFRATRS
jgi:FkbM family methyltransferase